MSFKNLANNTKILSDPKFIEGLIVKALFPLEAEMIDLNTGQLSEGLYSTGKKMEFYESDEYAKFKKSIGSKVSPVRDQKVSGDFYEGWTVEFKSNFVLFDSSDSKTSTIVKRDGIDVFGLTNKSVSELVELGLSDNFQDLFLNELTKNM